DPGLRRGRLADAPGADRAHATRRRAASGHPAIGLHPGPIRTTEWRDSAISLVPPDRIELSTSPLPRVRSTTELRRPEAARTMPQGRWPAQPAWRSAGRWRHDVVIKAPPNCQDASLGWPSILGQEAGDANPRPVLQAVAGGAP